MLAVKTVRNSRSRTWEDRRVYLGVAWERTDGPHVRFGGVCGVQQGLLGNYGELEKISEIGPPVSKSYKQYNTTLSHLRSHWPILQILRSWLGPILATHRNFLGFLQILGSAHVGDSGFLGRQDSTETPVSRATGTPILTERRLDCRVKP